MRRFWANIIFDIIYIIIIFAFNIVTSFDLIIIPLFLIMSFYCLYKAKGAAGGDMSRAWSVGCGR